MPRKLAIAPIRQCSHCNNTMERKRYPNSMEDMAHFLKRKYCDQICMAKAMIQQDVTLGGLRSRARKFRKTKCETCGTTENLQIHHIDSNPANNSPRNLMTLCGVCHTKWHWANGKSASKQKQAKPCLCCEKIARHNGLCNTHYTRYRRNGDPNIVRKIVNGKWVAFLDGGKLSQTSEELPMKQKTGQTCLKG